MSDRVLLNINFSIGSLSIGIDSTQLVLRRKTTLKFKCNERFNVNLGRADILLSD